jgi:hypothetical protein
MTLAEARRCPHCVGNLYLEPDLTERHADLFCLQCARRLPYAHRSTLPLPGKPDRGYSAAPAATREVGLTQWRVGPASSLSMSPLIGRLALRQRPCPSSERRGNWHRPCTGRAS